MKKFLYGTSALIAAGLLAGPAFAQQAAPAKKAAEKLQLGITGYWVMNYVVASQDERGRLPLSATSNNFTNQGGTGCGTPPRRRNHSMFNEGEVHFQGQTTLDNGVKVGLRVELEASRNPGSAATTANGTGNGGTETTGNFDSNIDQTFAWFAGAMGKVEMGQTWGAAFNMQYNGPTPIPGFGNFANQAPLLAPGNSANGTNAASTPIYNIGGGFDDRNQKVAIYTPRFYGIQIGVSYTPDTDANARSGNQVDQMNMDNNAGAQSQIVQYGLNYREKFGGVQLGLSAGYLKASAEPCTNSAFLDCKSTANGITVDDRRQWAVGGNVSFSGVTLGGTYKHDNQGLKNPGRETVTWQLSGNYKWNEWTFGLEYIKVEAEATTTTNTTNMRIHTDTLDMWMIGAIYNVGPGIDFYGGVIRADWANGDPTVSGDTKLAQENKATYYVVGTRLLF